MAKVKLHRVQNNTGEAEPSSGISVHGMFTPVRFDKNGFALVEEEDWVEWIAPVAAAHGIHLVPSTTRKKKT